MSNNWRTVPLSEVCDINPRSGKTALSEEELFSFVPMAAVGAADGSIDVSAKRPYVEVKKGFTPFQSGDVLFAKITPCMENGKMAVVPHLENRYGFGSTEFHVIRPKAGIDPKFVYYHISAQSFRKEAAHHMTGAVGQKRVPTEFIKQSLIPLPPTIEDQQQIVAEIEKQFSRLDEAVASLKRIQANLKRYKVAVLKAAVEGKLTEQWRKEHTDVEAADQLLKRILAERRVKWEAEELAKMKAKGIKPKDDSWKKKYKEPAGPDTANLPELPEGWGWATVEQLAWKVQYGSSSKTNEDIKGVPVLRMGNIFEGALRLDELKYLPSSHEEFPELLLDEDDLLFNRTNSPELVGKTAVYSGHPSPCSFASYLIRVKFVDSAKSKYVCHYINSIYGRNWIVSVVSQQVGQANVNGSKLQALTIPLPSFDEQQVILEEIDRRLSVTEEMEATIETNLKRAERLRQTILHLSFGGAKIE